MEGGYWRKLSGLGRLCELRWRNFRTSTGSDVPVKTADGLITLRGETFGQCNRDESIPTGGPFPSGFSESGETGNLAGMRPQIGALCSGSGLRWMPPETESGVLP